MTHSEMLQVLRLRGMDDVSVAVALGEVMGGRGPSPYSVYRWRTGKHQPTRVFQDSITTLYQREIGENDVRQESTV